MPSFRAAQFRSFDAVGIVLMTMLLVGSSALLIGTFAITFFRAYPFQHSDRLVMIWESDGDTGVDRLPVTEHAFPIYQERLSSFEALAHFFPPRPQLPATLAETSEEIFIAGASPDLFSVVGVSPLLGRVFLEEESKLGAAPVAVVSYAFWQRALGGDRGAIGRNVYAHWLGRRHSFRVVGVLPKGFAFPHPLYPDRPDLWVAIQQVGGTRFLPGHNFYVIGRAKRGVPISAIQAEVSTVASQIRQAHPQVYGAISATATPLRAESLRDVAGVAVVYGIAFLLLMGIGFTNILHLIVARTRGRRGEFAIRLALGASRGALIGLLAADAAILGIVGSAMGSVFAMWSAGAMLRLLPPGLHVPSTAQTFPLVALLATALIVSAVIALLGAVLGWRIVSNDSEVSALRQTCSVASDLSPRMRRAGNIALLVQIGAACALTTVTLGLIQHADSILALGQQVKPETLLSLDIRFDNDVDDSALIGLEGLLADPGPSVQALALLDRYPYSGVLSPVEIQGTSGGKAATLHVASASLLHVFGLGVLEGRWFDATDAFPNRATAVVNESFSQRYLTPARGRAIGSKIEADFGAGMKTFEVVGVVHDPARFGVQGELPAVYVPWERSRMRNVTMVARTIGDARNVAAPLRDAALALSPGTVRVRDVRTGRDLLMEDAVRFRQLSAQLRWVSLVALLLATGGTCSLLLFRAASRTKEFAIRRAVGSTGGRLVLLILGEVAVLLSVGLLGGWVAALLLNCGLPALDATLAGLRVLPFLQAGLIIWCAGLLASIPPLVRALSVDPAEVLRA